MRVHLGCDHAGLDLKAHLTERLTELGYDVVDHGPFVYDALDDYPSSASAPPRVSPATARPAWTRSVS